jgi:hypothetical protein
MRNGRLFLAGGALLALVVIGLGWLIGASPMLAAASENERQTAEIDAMNTAEEIEIALMREQFENIDELRAELDELQLSVPGFTDMAAYFDELAAKAEVATVALQGVTVSGAQPYGAMSSTEVADAEGTEGSNSSELIAPLAPSGELADSLYVLKLDLTIDADAPRLAAFLAALQGDGRLMLVTNVEGSFGTSQRATISGYVFVVHDPRLGRIGALPTPAPTPTGEASTAPEETDDAPTPDPTETPTP